jgi:hypothetical protein
LLKIKFTVGRRPHLGGGNRGSGDNRGGRDGRGSWLASSMTTQKSGFEVDTFDMRSVRAWYKEIMQRNMLL